MKIRSILFSALTLASTVGLAGTASAFDISFQWGNIPLCTTGNPNTVANPVFRITNPPAGAVQLHFKLVDKDVPRYDHGGGRITYAGQAQVPSGVFNYKSPCPPRGQHTYEWQVTAYDAQGRAVGSAAAQRRYPE